MRSSLHLAWALARESDLPWGQLDRSDIDAIAAQGGSTSVRAAAVAERMEELGLADRDHPAAAPQAPCPNIFAHSTTAEDVGWVVEESDGCNVVHVCYVRYLGLGELRVTVFVVGDVNPGFTAEVEGRVWANAVRAVARVVAAVCSEQLGYEHEIDKVIAGIHEVCDEAAEATASGDEQSVIVLYPDGVVELAGEDAADARAILAEAEPA